MPAHTVDATIMRTLYILTGGLTSGIQHLDAPALYHACINHEQVCSGIKAKHQNYQTTT